jgi:hypothetical protein
MNLVAKKKECGGIHTITIRGTILAAVLGFVGSLILSLLIFFVVSALAIQGHWNDISIGTGPLELMRITITDMFHKPVRDLSRGP